MQVWMPTPTQVVSQSSIPLSIPLTSTSLRRGSVWSHLRCRKHFRWYHGKVTTCRLHLDIDEEQYLFPSTPWWIYHASITINAAQPQSVCSVRISHVKWRVHDVVHCMFASSDHAMRHLVTVFHASEQPAHMIKSNWLHTLTSGSINMDGWQI